MKKKATVAFFLICMIFVSTFADFPITAEEKNVSILSASGGAIKIVDFSDLTEGTLFNNIRSADSGNKVSVNTDPAYTLNGAPTSLRWDMKAATGSTSGITIESDINISQITSGSYKICVKYYACAPESFADDEFKFYRRIGVSDADGKILFKGINGMTFKVSAKNTNVWRGGHGLETGTSADISELNPAKDSKIFVRLTSNGGKSSYPIYIDGIYLVPDDGGISEPFNNGSRLLLSDFGNYDSYDALASDCISGGSAALELNTEAEFIYPGKKSSLKWILPGSEKWFGVNLRYQRDMWFEGALIKTRIYNAGENINSINLIAYTVDGESGWKPYTQYKANLTPGWNEISIEKRSIDKAVASGMDVGLRFNCAGWKNTDYTPGDALYFDSIAIDAAGILNSPVSSVKNGAGYVDGSFWNTNTLTLRYESMIRLTSDAISFRCLSDSGEEELSGYEVRATDNLIKIKFDSCLEDGKYALKVSRNGLIDESGKMPGRDFILRFAVGCAFYENEYRVGNIEVSDDGKSASVEMSGDLPAKYSDSVLIAAVYGENSEFLKGVGIGYLEGDKISVEAEDVSDGESVKFIHLESLSSMKPMKAESCIGVDEDGSAYNQSDSIPILDFANIRQIQNTGAAVSKEHSDGRMNFSMHWDNHIQNKILYIKEFNEGVPADWSEYSKIKIDIYSAKATNATIKLVAYSRNTPDTNEISYYCADIKIDWTGMKSLFFDLYSMSPSRNPDITQMKRIDLVADKEWSMVANPETDLWISSLELVETDRFDFTESFYGEEKIALAYDAMKGSVAVFAGGTNAVDENGETPLDYAIEYKSESVMVPVKFFSEMLNANVKTSDNTFTITLGSKKVSGKVGEKTANAASDEYELEVAPYEKDGMIYVPGKKIAELLAISSLEDGRLLALGTKEMVNALKRRANLGVNELNEIVAQKACEVKIDPDMITKEDIETAKANWKKMLVGDETNSTAIAEIGTKIKTINTNCKNSRTKLTREPEETIFDGVEMNSSQDLVTCYVHVRNMAYAYGCFGSDYYKNEELLSDIIFALDWLGENYYNKTSRAEWEKIMPGLSNWHSWDVNIPQSIIETILCIEENLTPEQIDGYLEYFYTRLKNPNSTAANYSHEAQLIAGAALLRSDASTVMQMAVSILRTLLYVDDNERIVENKILERDFEVLKRGSGFFTDGSYVFHTFHAMNGTYGVKHFKAITDFQRIVSGTAFDVKSSLKYNIPEFFFDTIVPVTYGTAIFRGVLGRTTYPNNSSGAIPVLMYAFSIADNFEPEIRDEIYSYVKTAYKNTVYKSTFINHLTLDNIRKFKEVISDSSIGIKTGRKENRTLYNIDKTYHIREDWAIGISMSSSRIFNYESINSENLTGWYLGDGRTEWLLPGSKIKTNASSNYWKCIDPYRLPGTTVDTQERKAVSIYQGNEYLSSKDFVGGVSLGGEYGASAMDLESYHYDEDFGVERGLHGGLAPAHKCDLVAKKAYFMTDDGVICLGAGINAKDNNNAEVLTIVDNLAAVETVYVSNEGVNYGDDTIVADGDEITVRKADVSLSGKKWLNYSDMCGYVFPEGANTGALKARRTPDDPSTSAMESYFEMWVSHGVNPTDAGYAYVLLPGATSDETKAFAESQSIEILSNTPSVQAAKDKRTGITYIVFWQSGSFGDIEVSEPCMVMTREADKGFEIAVSDPTQKLDSLEVTIHRFLGNARETDECASSEVYSEITKITYDLTEAVGRSIECRFIGE